MKEKAYGIAELVREYRRDFHLHPELGFQETRTSEKVATILEGLGYRVRRGVARTGVVAELGQGKPMVAIRADMDGLPIQEANDVPYASQTPGVMHACGHDAHTAIALGVATLLKDEQFSGTVRFLFQPSEDGDDEEGISGAPRMIEAGAMEGVSAILGLHVEAGTPAGMIRMCPGLFLAGADLFEASILGAGGHGGAPHLTIDPIHIAGHVILALNAIVSRRIPAYETAVVSLGKIQGGVADTIIPAKVDLAGTIRYANQDVRKKIHEEMEHAFSIARSLGGDYWLKIKAGSIPTINDPRMYQTVIGAAEDLFGKERIKEHTPVMYGDDFANYARMVPAGYFFVGCEIQGDVRRHHDPRFDIDESCLPVGVAVMAEAALRLMR
jgi:amidohydrolase